MGYIKIVQREDGLQAAMAGLMTRQLTQPEEKSILEIQCGSRVGNSHADHQPSGGIKVEIALATAMWQNPHVPILDESTLPGLRRPRCFNLGHQDHKGGCSSSLTWKLRAGDAEG